MEQNRLKNECRATCIKQLRIYGWIYCSIVKIKIITNSNIACKSDISRTNPTASDTHEGKRKRTNFPGEELFEETAEKCLFCFCSDSRDPSSAAWA